MSDKGIQQLKNEITKLRNENNLLKTVIDEIPGSIYWKDINGVYLGRNKYAHQMMLMVGLEEGTTVSSAIGKTDYDYFTKEVADNYHTNDMQVICGRKEILKEEVIILSDGKEITQLSVKKPLCDENGNVIGIVGNTVDITAEREAEKLRTEQEEIKKKVEQNRQAAGNIAHDLRTPLSSIKFAISAIESVLPQLLETYQLACSQGAEVQPIRKNKLKGISTAISRCKSEIDFSNHYIDLILGNLKYDAIDTSNYAHHNIIKTIGRSLEAYPYQPHEKGLIFWEPKIDFNFFGNDFYLKNIINNLLKNAFFYIKKHERGQIFITTDENDDWYLLKVRDTAQGAPTEVLQHMFDGYYSKREGGTGLGLAFCKTIMESFGGSIRAESVEGEYMLFILSFPKKGL